MELDSDFYETIAALNCSLLVHFCLFVGVSFSLILVKQKKEIFHFFRTSPLRFLARAKEFCSNNYSLNQLLFMCQIRVAIEFPASSWASWRVVSGFCVSTWSHVELSINLQTYSYVLNLLMFLKQLDECTCYNQLPLTFCIYRGKFEMDEADAIIIFSFGSVFFSATFRLCGGPDRNLNDKANLS